MKTIFVAVVLAVCALGALGDDWYGDDWYDDGRGYYPSFGAPYASYGTAYPLNNPGFVPVATPGFGGPLAFGAGYGAAQNNGGGLFGGDNTLLLGGGLLLLALLLRNSNTNTSG